MDSSNSLPISIETHVDYDQFTLAERDWLPEARDGMALTAMQNDIKDNGLLHPIEADESNCVWCGRLRLLACQELKIPFTVRRIKSEDGEAAARRDLKHRMLTVLDQIRCVGAVIDKLDADLGKKCPRAKIAEYMKAQYGWLYGSSDKQMEHLRDLHTALRGLSTEKMEILRGAKSVNKAREALGLKDASKSKKGEKLTVEMIRDELNRILDLAPKGADQEKAPQVIKELRKLLAKFPVKKTKSDEAKPKQATSKKTKSTKPQAA